MYRTPAEDPPEGEEAIRLPLQSGSRWLAIALVGLVALALGSGLSLLRWQIVQATEAQPPLRISTRIVYKRASPPGTAPPGTVPRGAAHPSSAQAAPGHLGLEPP